MSNINYIPWVEKYRPKKMDDLTQDEKLMNLFKNFISSGDISHLLLYGPPGTGKTSAILAIGREIFKEHFSTRVIEFNASDDRGINAVREKITNEAKKFVTATVSADGTPIPSYKIIILDEADSMTDEAQDALRVIIEKYSTVTRFCFICNYICKITDAIKSRCYSIYFKKLDIECMINKLRSVADTEKITIEDETLDIIVDVSNGDMRKAIMMLQNLKYLSDLKKVCRKNPEKMTRSELKALYMIMKTKKNDTKEIHISEKDVYNIFAYVDNATIGDLLNRIFDAKSVLDLSKLSKQIIALGYPVDNVMIQINTVLIASDDITDIQKAKIMKYTGDIYYKMKMSANEYIQLLDYVTCINGVCKGYGLFG